MPKVNASRRRKLVCKLDRRNIDGSTTANDPNGTVLTVVAYFLGLPDSGGAIVGALTAALVLLDPTGAIWGTRQPRVPIVPSGIGADSPTQVPR